MKTKTFDRHYSAVISFITKGNILVKNKREFTREHRITSSWFTYMIRLNYAEKKHGVLYFTGNGFSPNKIAKDVILLARRSNNTIGNGPRVRDETIKKYREAIEKIYEGEVVYNQKTWMESNSVNLAFFAALESEGIISRKQGIVKWIFNRPPSHELTLLIIENINSRGRAKPKTTQQEAVSKELTFKSIDESPLSNISCDTAIEALKNNSEGRTLQNYRNQNHH